MATLKTVKQFAQDNPWCTEASLRNLIFTHAPLDSDCPHSSHALQKGVKRIGRRVLIDEEIFIDLFLSLDRATKKTTVNTHRVNGGES